MAKKKKKWQMKPNDEYRRGGTDVFSMVILVRLGSWGIGNGPIVEI